MDPREDETIGVLCCIYLCTFPVQLETEMTESNYALMRAHRSVFGCGSLEQERVGTFGRLIYGAVKNRFIIKSKINNSFLCFLIHSVK